MSNLANFPLFIQMYGTCPLLICEPADLVKDAFWAAGPKPPPGRNGKKVALEIGPLNPSSSTPGTVNPTLNIPSPFPCLPCLARAWRKRSAEVFRPKFCHGCLCGMSVPPLGKSKRGQQNRGLTRKAPIRPKRPLSGQFLLFPRGYGVGISPRFTLRIWGLSPRL